MNADKRGSNQDEKTARKSLLPQMNADERRFGMLFSRVGRMTN